MYLLLDAANSPKIPPNFGKIQFEVFVVSHVVEAPAAPPPQPVTPTKYSAAKKETTTFLGRTILPPHVPSFTGRSNIWHTERTVWKFSVAYRGEAWAITAGFLPRKYEDDEETEVGNLPIAKRQKVETQEEREIREAMAELSYSSFCSEFFDKLAEVVGRDPEDFDPIVRSLKTKGVTTVEALVKVSDAQFMTTHLPARMSPAAKRNVSNLIRQHLEAIPKPVVRLDIDDD